MRISETQLAGLDDFHAWNEGKTSAERISLLDYATFNATPELLFAFAALLLCDLIEVEGHYFIADRFNRVFYERWKLQLNDGKSVQRVMNHLHISTLLQNAELTDDLAKSCADLIASAWSEAHAAKGVVGEVHGTTLDDLAVTLVNGR